MAPVETVSPLSAGMTRLSVDDEPKQKEASYKSSTLPEDERFGPLQASNRGRAPARGSSGAGGAGSVRGSKVVASSSATTTLRKGDKKAETDKGSDDAPKIDRRIVNTLKTSAEDPNSHILLVGYSPTGGGHTDRLLNVIHEGLNQGTLTPGSTVVLQVPEQWDGAPRPASLNTLAQRLREHNVSVIVAQADKSVYGYLDKETGGSDDAKIWQRFGEYPLRKHPELTPLLAADRALQQNGPEIEHIGQARVYDGSAQSFTSIPVISAKALVQSLSDTIGTSAMESKVRVLTDMDSFLQAKADAGGVPGEHRVDQQNHAILLNLADFASDNVGRNSLLAKVLGGTGEMPSHIELGEKNTLPAMVNAASQLGITDSMTKAQARDAVVTRLLEHRDGSATAMAESRRSGRTFEGIIVPPGVESSEDIKNVVYVYAHKNANRIAFHVDQQVHAGARGYDQTLFVFCGRNAVPGLNAMHASYLAEADGITTAGAGTNGEFSYLHKHGGSKAQLMVLPILGHNEQKANAGYLTENEHTSAHVVEHAVDEALEDHIDVYVRRGDAHATEKYANEDMSGILNAVRDDSSYVRQTHDLLTGASAGDSPEKLTSNALSAHEKALRDSAVLDANRKIGKLISQALTHAERMLDEQVEGSPARTRPLMLAVTAKPGGTMQFRNLMHFVTRLKSDAWLTSHFGQGRVDLNPRNVLLLKESRQLLDNIGFYTNTDRARQEIHKLREEFGSTLTTGF